MPSLDALTFIRVNENRELRPIVVPGGQ